MPVYLPDTNLFRYMDNNDLETYKQAAREFFTMARQEIVEGKSQILVSPEVKCELEVQMHTLKAREQQSVRNLLAVLPQSTNTNLPIDLERDLRIFSNYIRSSQFKGIFKIPHYKHDYLHISDARILADAYRNDAVLVTANIKDFIVYSLFNEPGEQKLYDFLNKCYVEVPPETRAAIATDPLFLTLQTKLETLLP